MSEKNDEKIHLERNLRHAKREISLRNKVASSEGKAVDGFQFFAFVIFQADHLHSSLWEFVLVVISMLFN